LFIAWWQTPPYEIQTCEDEERAAAGFRSPLSCLVCMD